MANTTLTAAALFGTYSTLSPRTLSKPRVGFQEFSFSGIDGVFGTALGQHGTEIAWSGIFFKMRRPDWALREVVLLWCSVLSLVIVLGASSTWAGILLLPYLLWVSIASFLNLRIVQMNGPFG